MSPVITKPKRTHRQTDNQTSNIQSTPSQWPRHGEKIQQNSNIFCSTEKGYKGLCCIFWNFLLFSVHGGWSNWDNSGECSTSCGSGTQRQTRLVQCVQYYWYINTDILDHAQDLNPNMEEEPVEALVVKLHLVILRSVQVCYITFI